MSTSDRIDRVGGPTRSKTVSQDQVYELDHGEEVYGAEAVVFTDEGAYAVPGNASAEDVRTEVGADEAYMKVLSESRDRTAAPATAVDEDELNELATMAGSPFAVLDGKVQAREGQSTDVVSDRGYVPGSIDRID